MTSIESSIIPTKWCKYCAKDTHDSAECWSTHAIPPEKPVLLDPLLPLHVRPNAIVRAIDAAYPFDALY
jgi:hypothetical protein